MLSRYQQDQEKYGYILHPIISNKPIAIRVMKFEHGINYQILDKIIEQLDIILIKYSRVLVTLLNFHVNKYSTNNKALSDFNKKVMRIVKSKYGKTLGYIWVREINDSINQHYHFAYFLNGHKIKHPLQFNQLLMRIWKEDFSGHSSIPKYCFSFIDRNKQNYLDTIFGCLYRLSYLAKNFSKQYKNKKAKSYQASRLKYPD
ncbi:inovirus Gp2 family protein [Colwellia sp. Arc7-635]|jgi:hypothetical protein|uniref:YagK/YfjJ domain-containing protein n=1 Tax=Colwellia sp. Arc7-635 TaxID=2497879 RepID=UPI000F853125|nr:inovirus-type Gp2 protein [Colwellia sp. Arc7-635]AZQ85320.1 inovirus Gp2 family protein [Colwellia sp. Arc7-635]